MTFYSSIDTTILFDDWQTHTVGQYIGALVAVMLMGLARQALVWARKQLPSWVANGYFTICSSEDSFYPLASVPLTYGTTPKATDGGAEPCCCDESADHKVSVHSGGSDDDNKSDESATAMPSAAGPSRETSVLSIEVPTPGTSNGIVARGVHKGYRDAEITSGQESKSAGPSLQYSNQAGQTQVSTGVARCVGGRLANPMQVLRSRPHLLAWLRAADALLHTIVTAVAFLNMLVAMSERDAACLPFCT